MTADTLLRVNDGVRRRQRPSNPTLVSAQTVGGGVVADLLLLQCTLAMWSPARRLTLTHRLAGPVGRAPR